jgi:hypothetical protein
MSGCIITGHLDAIVVLAAEAQEYMQGIVMAITPREV